MANQIVARPATHRAEQDDRPRAGIGFDCRFCGTPLEHTLVDLGMSPLCESYVRHEDLHKMEAFYPLHVGVCHHCYLAQLEEFVSAEDIFTEYAYFSSFADSWVQHAKDYAHLVVKRFGLNRQHTVVEVASNDGYLLQHFVELGIPNYGIEPAENVAEEATKKGVETVIKFFGVDTAQELAAQGRQADLLLGNNVLAQVPDLNDFVAGMKIMLKPEGVITMEFPHLLRLMQENQFDTIYHEHFSYFSFITVERVFAAHGLTLFDVEQIPTHGGSLRIYSRHTEDDTKSVEPRVNQLRAAEIGAGLDRMETYASFAEQVKETKRKILEFLIRVRRDGKQVVGYGAPGKGNTLLNYCGIRTDFIDFTVDRNPYKQGKYLPGSRIPIFAPDKIDQARPDYVVVMPWNFKAEIIEQLAHIRAWGGKFVIFIPEVAVL
jgi:2-polyprenyl-3-methyl-5-hydroxy-6-metoxy-1,4-benzoquinol methylase